jgi:hypothetical protein
MRSTPAGGAATESAGLDPATVDGVAARNGTRKNTTRNARARHAARALNVPAPCGSGESREMEHEDTRRPALIGYDERTETWFVRSEESQRLMLTRQSLAHLVEMYNSVHTGRPIVLVEERDLRRLREAGRRAEEARAAASAAQSRLPARRLALLAARVLARLASPLAPPPGSPQR